MSVPMDIQSQLIRDEGGVRTRMYYVNGIPHIAAGHNLNARPISDYAARVITKDDYDDTADEVKRLLPWVVNLEQPRYAVIVNVAYWAGMDGLLEFHRMLAAIKQRDWRTAARELLDSHLVTTDKDRADRLAQQLEDGQWR